MVIGFKFCRRNARRRGARRRGGLCIGLNGPEAPAGAEPAVEKTLAASWTPLQGEICPWQAAHNVAMGY